MRRSSLKLERRPYTSREFLYKLGEQLWNETGNNGILTAAYRANVPIFCPAIADSSIGMGLSQARHRDQTAGFVDVIGDIIESANIVIRRPSTATIVLGGGTPKNFINQASVQAEFYDDRVGGHKYAIQIVTDVPYFGGASGSSLEEAQSWGKLSIESEKVTVHADVTLALPLLVTRARNHLARERATTQAPGVRPVRPRARHERPAARRQPLPGVLMSSPVEYDDTEPQQFGGALPEPRTFEESARRHPAGAVRSDDVVRVGHAQRPARAAARLGAGRAVGRGSRRPTSTRAACSRCRSWISPRSRSRRRWQKSSASPADSSTPASSWSRSAASTRSPRRSSAPPRRGIRACRCLQIDAHADLRDTYLAEKHSHACAMRRTLEFAPLVQVGIRNISGGGSRSRLHRCETTIFYDWNMRDDPGWIDRAVDALVGRRVHHDRSRRPRAGA